MNSKEEIWKDIKNYEGLYQISNFGNIKSLERKIKNKNGYRVIKEKILKPLLYKNGYLYIYLGGKNRYRIHRLVAQAFISNPNNLPQVNHINGIKNDNKVENLEWVTASENTKHAYDNGLAKHTENQTKALINCNKNKRKKVALLDTYGNMQKTFDSAIEASKKLKIPVSCISRVCRNKRKSTHKMKFKYV